MKTLTPQQATTEELILKLESDNLQLPQNNGDIHVSHDHVAILGLDFGLVDGMRRSYGYVTMSREDFDRIVEWYLKPQKVVASKDIGNQSK